MKWVSVQEELPPKWEKVAILYFVNHGYSRPNKARLHIDMIVLDPIRNAAGDIDGILKWDRYQARDYSQPPEYWCRLAKLPEIDENGNTRFFE